MEYQKRILCLDFDDVIMKSKPVVERIIENTDIMASEKYLNGIISMVACGDIDADMQRELTQKHYDLKDRILEEVDDKYKGLIDYRKVVNIDNIYEGSIGYITYLCNCGHYDKIYIVSHCNVDREIEVKKEFIQKYLPKVEFIPVPFHIEPYEEGKKRKRTSKAQYLKDYLHVQHIYNYSLIDDSYGNGADWLEHGGIYLRFNPNSKGDSITDIRDLNPLIIQSLAEYPKLEDGRKK